MDYIRRVTLRCLCQDLSEDWGDASQLRDFRVLWDVLRSDHKDSGVADLLESLPTVGMADHPLVRSFRAAFEAGGHTVRRESISGLTSPHWWKQKVSRWRGAATDSDLIGDSEAWLCAGGLRAAGDERDFYRSFMSRVATGGAEQFLPDQNDRRLQRIESKIARREAWARQIQLSALVCLDRAYHVGIPVPFHVPAPSPCKVESPLLHLEFDVARETVEGEELNELYLRVSSQDLSRPNLVEEAVHLVREIVEPIVDEWRLLPGQGYDLHWSTIVSQSVIKASAEAVESGELPEPIAESDFRLAVRAHYAKKNSLVDATIDGEPVRGLCGKWFVPTMNPDHLDVCSVCADAYLDMDSSDEA